MDNLGINPLLDFWKASHLLFPLPTTVSKYALWNLPITPIGQETCMKILQTALPHPHNTHTHSPCLIFTGSQCSTCLWEALFGPVATTVFTLSTSNKRLRMLRWFLSHFCFKAGARPCFSLECYTMCKSTNRPVLNSCQGNQRNTEEWWETGTWEMLQ